MIGVTSCGNTHDDYEVLMLWREHRGSPSSQSVVFYSDDMLDCDGVFSQCIVSSVDDYLGGAALGVVNIFVARSGDDGVRCPDVDVRSVEPSMEDLKIPFRFYDLGLAKMKKILSRIMILKTLVLWGIGTVVPIGAGGEASVAINSLILFSGRTLKCTTFGGVRTQSDLPVIIDKCLNKEIQLDELLTHEIQLENIQAAFEILKKPDCVKILINF
nr:alcohol dehydrogenase-like 1 [Tanacetum cinerariifolium]